MTKKYQKEKSHEELIKKVRKYQKKLALNTCILNLFFLVRITQAKGQKIVTIY